MWPLSHFGLHFLLCFPSTVVTPMCFTCDQLSLPSFCIQVFMIAAFSVRSLCSFFNLFQVHFSCKMINSKNSEPWTLSYVRYFFIFQSVSMLMFFFFTLPLVFVVQNRQEMTTLTLKGKQWFSAARDICAVSKGFLKRLLSCMSFSFLLHFSYQLGRVYRSANMEKMNTSVNVNSSMQSLLNRCSTNTQVHRYKFSPSMFATGERSAWIQWRNLNWKMIRLWRQGAFNYFGTIQVCL